MKLNQIFILAAIFVPMLSFAGTAKMSCTSSTVPSLIESLTIVGSGIQALIHIEDSVLAGDLTYDENATNVAANSSMFPTHSVGYSGTITSKLENPPVQGQATFFIQASVLDGKSGKLSRFGDEGISFFDCK